MHSSGFRVSVQDICFGLTDLPLPCLHCVAKLPSCVVQGWRPGTQTGQGRLCDERGKFTNGKIKSDYDVIQMLTVVYLVVMHVEAAD
ncbi:unnamed protein product [Ilex paraguariensis]|uniref:Uncharacterized protein n=1 Tax=Ilex paraguariensis TaxID=185542 RepID=A0ABC8U9N8_9AQUA